MTIPDYETIMLPLLKFSEKRGEFSSKDAVTNMSKEFALGGGGENALLPNRKQTVIYNRVQCALSYLKHSVLLESTEERSLKNNRSGKASS